MRAWNDITPLLAQLRADGWRVGVHNDYVLNGELMTFWMLTHPCGVYVKGEGATDLIALNECAEQARKTFAPSP